MVGQIVVKAEPERVQVCAQGLILLPCLMGAMAPTWNAAARGTYFGFTLAHTRAHFVRALLEASAYAVRDITDQMGKIGLPLHQDASGTYVNSRKVAGPAASYRLLYPNPGATHHRILVYGGASPAALERFRPPRSRTSPPAFSQFAENLWRGLGGYQGRASFRSWALRIAHHAALNLRDQAWQKRGRRLETGEASRIAAEVRTASAVRVERRTPPHALASSMTANAP